MRYAVLYTHSSEFGYINLTEYADDWSDAQRLLEDLKRCEEYSNFQVIPEPTNEDDY